MLKLGITGGIGSGKSVITRLLSIVGIPVYIADTESKKLTATSPVIREKLINAFGKDLYEGNTLNKPLLASYIFNDEEKLRITNAIIHPEVEKHFKEWLDKYRTCPIVAQEAAILFESGFNIFMDKTLMVYTPLDLRIERVMARDKASLKDVQNRIKNQIPDEEKAKMCDYIIHNDGNQSLILQTANILKELGYSI